MSSGALGFCFPLEPWYMVYRIAWEALAISYHGFRNFIRVSLAALYCSWSICSSLITVANGDLQLWGSPILIFHDQHPHLSFAWSFYSSSSSNYSLAIEPSFVLTFSIWPETLIPSLYLSLLLLLSNFRKILALINYFNIWITLRLWPHLRWLSLPHRLISTYLIHGRFTFIWLFNIILASFQGIKPTLHLPAPLFLELVSWVGPQCMDYSLAETSR